MVRCAGLAKRRTAVGDDWIAEGIEMGHPSSMSQNVNRMCGDPEGVK